MEGKSLEYLPLNLTVKGGEGRKNIVVKQNHLNPQKKYILKYTFPPKKASQRILINTKFKKGFYNINLSTITMQIKLL